MSARSISSQTQSPFYHHFKTFSKNGLFGGVTAVGNTGLSVISALASFRFFMDPRLNLKQLGSCVALLTLLRFLTLYKFEQIIAPRYRCDVNSVRSGGYVGALMGIYTLFFQESQKSLWIAFLTGALVSGALAAKKSYCKIS